MPVTSKNSQKVPSIAESVTFDTKPANIRGAHESERISANINNSASSAYHNNNNVKKVLGTTSFANYQFDRSEKDMSEQQSMQSKSPQIY